MELELISLLPIEMTQKILYDLDIKSLTSICSSNKYLFVICSDDNFYENYVKLNYDHLFEMIELLGG